MTTKKTNTKNAAAQALGRLRWAGVSKRRRVEAAKAASAGRAKIPAKRRAAIARVAARARWAKKAV